MGNVSDGLILALLALPDNEKERVLTRLLEDQEFKLAAANFFMQGIDKLMEKNQGIKRRYTAHVGNLGLRANGNQLRDKYIDSLKEQGIAVNRMSNSWAKSLKGTWVALPLAGERMANRWFLGLGEKDVIEKSEQGGVVVIILCQTDGDEILDFIIPQSVMLQLIPKMSKAGGQLKFNIKRLGLRYQMTLPGIAPFDITDYRGNVSVLK